MNVKRSLALGLATAATVGAVAAPAHARVVDPDERNCVSHSEWVIIRDTPRWTQPRVEEFTETLSTPLVVGAINDGTNYRWYVHPACSSGLEAVFGYDTAGRLRALTWGKRST